MKMVIKVEENKIEDTVGKFSALALIKDNNCFLVIAAAK